MNVNHEKKLIWILPELSGGDFLYPILEKNGFVFEVDEKERIIKKHSKYIYSNNFDVLDGYKVVLSTRNPYQRMFFHFQKYSKTLIRASQLQPSIELFQKWINIHFYKSETKVNLMVEDFTPSFQNSFKIGDLSQKLPDYVVRVENMREDIQKITELQFGDVEYEELDGRIDIDFRKLYNPEIAHKVFWYYRNYFFLSDYDPLSFSVDKFTDDEKKIFIHEL